MGSYGLRHVLALLVVVVALIVAVAGNSLGLSTTTVLAILVGVLGVAVLLIPGP